MTIDFNSSAFALNDQLSVTADKDVAFCTLADGLALLDMRTGTYFSLNAVAAYIWSALERPIQIFEICRLVGERFDVNDVDCKQDILMLIGDMLKAGLVTISNVDGA